MNVSASDREMSFWPTPAEVADDLVYWLMEPWHALGDGVRVLEPSAGEGHLVRAIRERLPEAHITAVEPSETRAAALRATPGIEVVQTTLESYLADVTRQATNGPWQPFHLVIMNPPFTLPDRREAWAEHVLACYYHPHLLAPYGVIGAVVPRIVMTGRSKLVQKVRGLLDECGRARACERGAFSDMGAKVSTALIWTQKPYGEAESSGQLDLFSGAAS
ncbi:hypothetical protein FH608_046485 [Nonomuraea phyllanthi]|uniref:Methyltransferase n=1 Tax=Nonomuraea phyllanthi TaxID=2219224 RepID=A0A5C4V5W0_9ACTN|nr:hypothetical protein [Nonomuraea phyllanthi]KAB8186941.1 hypothetical protein FH608_046485 [Nonomuraea phyllanthi]